MQRSTVDISTPDGTADAYLVHPDGALRPGVLLLMDAFGLRPQIELMADRIAAEGYAVLAPNLFYRSGRAPVFPMPDLSTDGSRQAFFSEVAPLMGALTPDAVAADGVAYLAALSTAAAPGPLGIAGYCMGVRVGWRIAGTNADRIAALGGFHGGRLATDDPTCAANTAGALRCTVYLGHADGDGSNTPEQIATLDAALDAAGIEHTTEVYPGAPHGYTMADTPSYQEAGAERHYAALFDLLERTLG